MTRDARHAIVVEGPFDMRIFRQRASEQRGPSTWDSLRIPFFIVIISFILLLFATQKDLMTTTTALATALTTGLPMMMKLIGVFTERRLGADRM